MKTVLKWIGIILGVILLLAAALVIWLSVTEFKPAAQETASHVVIDNQADPLDPAEEITVLSWNTGYGGLGEESDFFMDGGEMVNPPSQAAVEKNLAGIQAFLKEQDADVWLLQEVDVNSSRTGGVNEFAGYDEAMGGSSAFAYNYKCAFVPFPLPPIGRVESGIATFTSCLMDSSPQRISLPCPFSWPVSTANLKRCLLVARLPLAGTDRELVLVNLHLEAYDDGEGKAAQTQMLVEILEQEYQAGNYVIAGGDFNQTFPGALEAYPIQNGDLWTPGLLENSMLPEGWSFVYDGETPTCRLLDKPYEAGQEHQFYVIDGFIVSPNVTVAAVETLDCGFEFTDHNPVRLSVRLR